MSDRIFGTLPNGSKVRLITLTNSHGMQVQLINYGARIHRIKAPDRSGVIGDVTLHCVSLDDYLRQTAFLGATIGRYANRINMASYTMDNHVIKLQPNEGLNQLHGGPCGFHSRVWAYKYGCNKNVAWAKFTLTSADGDQGFPGELYVEAHYLLDNQNNLQLTINAQSNKPTVINMTNHAYFNLSGNTHSDLSSHYVQIFSEQYLGLDANGIPTGKIIDVSDTVMDFSQPREISSSLNPMAKELIATRGYDHTYVFVDTAELTLKARIHHANSGRVLSVFSDHPSAQFYTGNYLKDCDVIGPGGTCYSNHSGFCIEPQRYPDSPNHAHFPSSTLAPGEHYNHTLEYRFSTLDIN